MNLQTYWHNLQRGHERSLSETVEPDPLDRKLNLVLAAVCSLAVPIVIEIGGYRYGFDAVRRIGLYFPVAFLETLSKFGETLAAVSLIALIAKRHPRAVWMGVLASVYATALTHALKGICETARPAAVLGDWVVVTGPVLKLHGFPSGHTMTAFLLAACFSAGVSGTTKLPFYALAALVGLSRVWVGAHWPVDVIAGAGISGLSVALAIPTMKFAKWGLTLGPHLLFVSLAAVCAVLELMTVPEHPLARLVGVAIAASSLSVLARDYVYRHAIAGRLRRRSTVA